MRTLNEHDVKEVSGGIGVIIIDDKPVPAPPPPPKQE